MLGVSKCQDLNSRYSQLFNYPNNQVSSEVKYYKVIHIYEVIIKGGKFASLNSRVS